MTIHAALRKEGLGIGPEAPHSGDGVGVKDTLSTNLFYRWDTGLFTMPRRLDNRPARLVRRDK